MLVAYIVLGVALGPWGMVTDTELIGGISQIGIIFLLFLLGLNLPFNKLSSLIGESLLVTGVSSVVFGLLGVGWLFGFSLIEQLVIGASMMFSSTIIGLKLLPTTILHHQHTGEIIISVLLLQDLIAIVILMALQVQGGTEIGMGKMALLVVSLPLLVLAAAAMLLKPPVFSFLLRRSGEQPHRSDEIGIRLGQISEFSLLIAVLALNLDVIGREASYMIQASAILTFIASSYFIVLKYPTPIAVSDRLRRD